MLIGSPYDQIRILALRRAKFLEQVIAAESKALERAPEGYLKGVALGKDFQYLTRAEKAGTKWRYIRNNDRDLARQLAQKTYHKKVLVSAQKEMAILKKIMTSSIVPVERLYSTLPLSIQMLVQPIVETPKQFYDQWRGTRYAPKEFSPDDFSNYHTMLGERVRSKSEIMIADRLTQHHIPYLYEKPLMLKGFGTIRPDFTLLDFANHREIYWEHLGLLDDKDYRESAVKKVREYEKNGIFPGKQLIITAETSRIPLDTDLVEILIVQLSGKCCYYSTELGNYGTL